MITFDNRPIKLCYGSKDKTFEIRFQDTDESIGVIPFKFNVEVVSENGECIKRDS